MSVAAFLMLLCSICIISRSATACPWSVGGPASFTAPPGGSQIQTWIAIDGAGGGSGIPLVTITSGSDVFIISQFHKSAGSDTVTFTVTFKPGANSTGTFKGTMTNTECDRTYELVGTVAASGVANTLPSDVSITITPNPATDFVNIISSGVRTAEIGIYDLLGKEIASSKTTNWKWDASNIATGSYIVRVTGESIGGDPFILSRRIIISR
jgi:hypothetical protein